MLGAHDLAWRLEQRFRVLTGGTRMAVSRHQTLRAAMDWSYELLSGAEQAVLRRLGAFPGSFDLEAAEAVVSGELPGAPPDLEVLDLLSGLVDKSLVGVHSEGIRVRYRLLETVRDYASEKLAEAGEGDPTRWRHRDWFLTLASTHEDPTDRTRQWSTGSWIRQAGSDYDNFGAALEWSLAHDDGEAAIALAAALWRYWWWARPLEGCDRLERALSTAAGGMTPERLEAIIGLGVLLPRAGRGPIQRGEDLLRGALGLALDAGAAHEAARARYFLGELAVSRGDPVEAEPLLRAALDAFESSDAPFSAAWCHHALGWMAMAGGKRSEAEEHFEAILDLTRRCPSAELLRVHAVAGLAPLAALAGDCTRAEELAGDGVAVARHLPAPGFLVMALTRAAEASLLCRLQPRPLLRELVGLLSDLGVRAWVEEVLEMVALVCEAADDVPGAARLLGACRAIAGGGGGRAQGRILSDALDRCRSRLVEQLGPDASAAHTAAGEAMSPGEALAFALAALEGEPAGVGRLAGSGSAERSP